MASLQNEDAVPGHFASENLKCDDDIWEKKRIAVIGAGCSGLAAIKSCLEEGLHPVCFERNDDIGGLWNYSEECGRPSVYKSCVINTSKEMSSFSDFPMPAHYPPFMPHHLMLEYFRSYGKHFDLFRHIKFETTVERITPASDYDDTGRYDITYRKTDDTQSAVMTEQFDGVMVCTGHFSQPHIPHFSGLSQFAGNVIHSFEYKTADFYKDKKVLIVGIGNSAVDIAVDISRVSKMVHISTRRGAWIVGRMGPLGVPADAVANSRFLFSMPRQWLQRMVEILANYKFDHDAYGVQPKHRALEAHPTINDELPFRIMVGAVQARSDVTHFTEHGAVFDDGTCEQYDAVILATGYNYTYSFVDKEVLSVKENRVELYKYVFPPQMKHPSLSVIGLVQAIGAVMPISEMQSRWYARVMAGHASLPPQEVMYTDIRTKANAIDEQYISSRRHTLETFWISYMDDLASQIKARPSLGELASRDPLLALRCFFGPCVPAQYRLHGPHRWHQAPKHIRSIFSNFVSGTKRRHVELKQVPRSTYTWIKDIVVVTICILLMAVVYEIVLF